MSAITAVAADQATLQKNKDIAIGYYNALMRGDYDAMRALGRADYIQHNPAAVTGLDGLIAYRQARPPAPDAPPLEFVRSIAEGDMVMLLRRVPSPTPADPDNVRAIIDIFRIEDGKVAEHWDYFEDFAHGNQRGPNPPMNANGVF